MATLARLRQKLLDGRYRWGHVSRRSGRYGATSIRVVIYPPHSTEAERRCARLVRFWPWLAGGGIAAAVPVLGAVLDVPVPALLGALVLLAVFAGIALGRFAAPVASGRAELFATVSALSPQEADRERYAHVAEVAEALHAAEEQLDGGLIGWDWYRALWAERHRDCLPR
ncbi:DUF6611 family protein [Brevibacterium album]|uniref:DUF6611 family protein n=1 Tax=Brevibacterium album TaxID=417948 RepID=UPI00041F728A|nr:DUF6611 family protein [Brevibacterium album]